MYVAYTFENQELDVQILKEIYAARYTWAYKNEESWFVMVGHHVGKTRYRFVAVDCLMTGHIGEVPYDDQYFTEEVLKCRERVEGRGHPFILYRFDTFKEFCEYYLREG